MITTVAFDADDTLWENERLFSMTQARYRQILSAYHSPEWIDKKLFETEMRNLEHFGYGVKGFALSMIETAIELTEGRISGREIEAILDFAKEMLAAPVELLPHVEETLSGLVGSYSLMVITKGDLINQESKIARSGLAEHFDHIEIVSEKHPETYQTILTRYVIEPASFLMVGNSLKSDVLPVVAVGGRAVHIPQEITWAHEIVDVSGEEKAYHELRSISQLPELLAELNRVP